MKKGRKFIKDQGITLVALIITIIILIILVAVSINTVLSSNFINLTTQGTVNYSETQVKEENELEGVAKLLENTINSVLAVDIPVVPSEPGENPNIPPIWNGDKVYAAESEDGIIVPVPKGFTVSDLEGERRVEDGFVIMHEKNEFVWIPVEDTSEMFGRDKDGKSLGKLYDFGNWQKPKIPPVPLNWTEDENKVMRI